MTPQPALTGLLKAVDRLFKVVGSACGIKIVRYFHQEIREERLMKKSIIYKLSPFNNETNMSVAEYIVKKLLAFILIYVFSAVLGEAIIIGSLYGMGYDPLNGIMPEGQIGELLVYYGFVIFSLVTLLYCRFIEKRKFKTIGFSGKFIEYPVGGLLAVILLVLIIGVACGLNAITFCGFNTTVNIETLLLWMLAFGIQGATEEIMCRGFLLHSLKDKVSVPLAIFVSSTAFVFPHLSSLLEAEVVYVIVGIINLYLISIIFSILVLWRSSIWVACGLHSIWNFVLYCIMGLTLTGSENVSDGVVLFGVKGANIVNGAEYGIEASIITTVVLGILVFAMVKGWKGRNGKNGIS